MDNNVDFVDGGSFYDPFGGDIPSYNDVLRQVQLQERIENDAEKIHTTSPPQEKTIETQVSQRVEHEPSLKQPRDMRANRHRFGW